MKRKSNIELLRILAFIMVIFIHVTEVGLVIPNGIESHSYTWYYATIMRAFVQPAVTLFILISGYVVYFNREKYSIKKNIKKILIPIIMLTPLLFVVNILVYGLSINTAVGFLSEMITFTGVYHHMWYVAVYLFIILITPMLINGIERYSKKNYTILLIIMYILIGITELINIVGQINCFQGMFSNQIIFFIAIFLTGYYINKYNVRMKKIINFILYIILFYVRYKIFLHYNPINAPLNFTIIANNFNILNILCAILIFLFFKELKTKENKIINHIAKLTYGAYIIHTFYIFYNQKFIPFTQFVKNENYYLFDIAFVLSVAICSLFTEEVRNLIEIAYKKMLVKLKKNKS